MTGWVRRHPVRAGGLVAAGLVVALVAAAWLGSAARRLPDPAAGGAGSGEPGQSVSPTVVVTPSARPGDSAEVTSSTGVDLGVGLPRLGDSPFALTQDPLVFAASVQAAAGYDYRGHQPDDATEEQARITREWLAGMTGEDGPLGAEVHRVMRESVGESIDPEELSYRIAAREVDSIDVLAVDATDNAELRAQGGNEVYLGVVANRDTLHALTVTAEVTTELQAVGDVSGFTRVQTTRTSMVVRCDPEEDDGVCELVGLFGGDAQ